MLPIRRTCHFLLDPQKGWTALKSPLLRRATGAERAVGGDTYSIWCILQV